MFQENPQKAAGMIMKKDYTFQIFTDNASNIPHELLEKYNIKTVPIHYYIDEKEQDINRPFDGKSFYSDMKNGLPVSTSMPNVTAFYEAFAPSLAMGYDIIYIGLSGGISGTSQLAKTVSGELSEKFRDRKITVIDTCGASLGEGLPVLYAARLRESGRDYSVVCASVKEKCRHMHQVFVVDDLQYLQRTGRVYSAAVKITTTFNVKPVLIGDSEGHIVLKNVALGKKRALDILVKKYKEECVNMNAPVGIAHADAEKDAGYVASKLKEAGCRYDILNVMYEPVTGSHVGPGTVALFFYGDERK